MVRMRPCIVVGLVMVGFGGLSAMNSSSAKSVFSMNACSSNVASGTAGIVTVKTASDNKEAKNEALVKEARLTNLERCKISDQILKGLGDDEKAWDIAVQQISDEKYFAKTDRLGLNLLHCAAQHNFVFAMAAFLQAGAELESRDYAGMTAFLWAVRAHSYTAVECLLQGGANRQAQDNRGWSAAHYAVQNGDEGMLAYLRSKGVNLTLKSKACATIEKLPVEIASTTTGALTPLELANVLLKDAKAKAEAARRGVHGRRNSALEASVEIYESIIKLLS